MNYDDARRFLYSEGFFTTIFIDRGVPFFLKDHLLRLNRSAQQVYSKSLPLDSIKEKILENSKKVTTATLRVDVCWRQERASLLTDDDGEFSFYYTLKEIPKMNHPMIEDQFVSLGVSSQVLGTPYFKEKIKQANYFELFAERKHSQYDDLLLIDNKGVICEATTSNIFLQIDGQWVTPKLNPNILPGVTRQNVLHFYPGIIEREIFQEELPSIEEGFLTNSRGLIVGISQIKDKRLDVSEVEGFKRDFLNQVYEDLNGQKD